MMSCNSLQKYLVMCAFAAASDKMYSFLAIAVRLSHISRLLELYEGKQEQALTSKKVFHYNCLLLLLLIIIVNCYFINN